MRLAIMQPYFFPYPGYFQLIRAVDKFVIHDDVQYIKGGWINKNRILLNGSYYNIGIPIRKDSAKKHINERYFVDDSAKFKIKLLRQIENAYKKAPFFEENFRFISRILSLEERNVSKFTIWGLLELCHLLKITTPFYLSSEINKQNKFSGEKRVIDINHVMGSSVYVNPIGGIELYNRESFLKENIELKFLKTDNYYYKQFNKDFVPNLSIIDLLMFNSVESAIKLLDKYHLE
jgi:hypothetical protein